MQRMSACIPYLAPTRRHHPSAAFGGTEGGIVFVNFSCAADSIAAPRTSSCQAPFKELPPCSMTPHVTPPARNAALLVTPAPAIIDMYHAQAEAMPPHSVAAYASLVIPPSALPEAPAAAPAIKDTDHGNAPRPAIPQPSAAATVLVEIRRALVLLLAVVLFGYVEDNGDVAIRPVELHEDVVAIYWPAWLLIIGKLPLDDFIRCTKVCSSFKRIVDYLIEKKMCNSEPCPPWVMHPAQGGDDHWTLVNTSIAPHRVYPILLPEIVGSTVVGSSEGWLILADKATADLRLFSPFSRAQVQLPPTNTLPHIVQSKRTKDRTRIKRYTIREAYGRRVSVTPNLLIKSFCAVIGKLKSGYVTVVSYGGEEHDKYIALAKSGEDGRYNAWTALETPVDERPMRFTLLDGLVYVMFTSGMLASFNPLEDDLVLHQVAPAFNHPGPSYMVGLQGTSDLVLINMLYDHDVEVRKLDRVSGTWGIVTNCDGYTLFLNDATKNSMSIKLSQDSHRPNCLYVAESELVGEYDVIARRPAEGVRVIIEWLLNVSRDGRGDPFWISPVWNFM